MNDEDILAFGIAFGPLIAMGILSVIYLIFDKKRDKI